MKKIFFIFFTILFYFYNFQTQAIEKIAVVNLSKVFQNSSQRMIVIKELEKEFRDRALELQNIEKDLKNKIDRLKKEKNKLSISESKALEKSIFLQKEQFANKAQLFERDNRRRQNEEKDKIIEQINKIIKSIAKKDGYDVVLDSECVIYLNNTKDITEEVLKQVK
ncbi:OmpH family outer membrane protein [bacterium endosymbiont of Pedicinus badii]|uniref:OmpH family outer membrane protein n=1 Tax=bacterium endosymbiont of Pedicinus badii TaxID=1719126 RepID=UPI0009BB564D|nr:OmpH family outer membrane protein [bacterium endosymbiont of Pedicinus badii]OQM33992.1 molecular chaperone [bacterium endosymbiont of Pedicinus badii]